MMVINEVTKSTCFYDILFQDVKGSMKSKAIKFDKLKLVEYYGENTWVVDPIPGYNKHHYTVKKVKRDSVWDFVCNCQGFVMKMKRFNEGDLDVVPVCSHILAVKLHAGREAHNKKVERMIKQDGGVFVNG